MEEINNENSNVKGKGQKTENKYIKDDQHPETGPQMPTIGEDGKKTLNAANEWGGVLINVV